MSRRYPLGLCLALGMLFAILGLGSLAHSLGTVLFASLAIYVIDHLLIRTDDVVILAGLNRIGADQTWRFFYRQVLVLVFLLRCGELSGAELAVVVIAVLLHHLAHAGYRGLRLVIANRRLRRLETRNLAVPSGELPPALPPWLIARGGSVVLHTDIVFTAGLGWAFISGSYGLVVPAVVLMIGLAFAVALALVPQVLALRRLTPDQSRLVAAEAAIRDLRPLVILYFSGGIDSVYQLNMWLETMERLDRRLLVLVRERRYWDELSQTSAPVLCLPFSVDLINFELGSARVALYVSNVGKNIHLLRVPTMKSAFIGHGDSDKTASFNPFSKVYDEVWVAGQAGRQRYLRAQVGVRDDEIVTVGRPQLDGIHETQARPAGSGYTVLYAPTWEGWVDDPHQSSLVSMGPEIVRLLLNDPGVRVLYKPHPLTGTVDPRAAHVSEQIVGLLRSAGAQHVAVLDKTPLYDCFDQSDALVSDISSVVSDYLRSEKPYFVTNGASVPESVFREQNPSAGAAYLVGPRADGLVDGLADARSADRLRARRTEVRTYLLGDPDADSMTLFRDAVDALAAKAEDLQSIVRSGVGDDDERLEQRDDTVRAEATAAEAGTGKI